MPIWFPYRRVSQTEQPSGSRNIPEEELRLTLLLNGSLISMQMIRYRKKEQDGVYSRSHNEVESPATNGGAFTLLIPVFNII